jgi:hypothetical protein
VCPGGMRPDALGPRTLDQGPAWLESGPAYRDELVEVIRVMVVAGVTVGAIVIGGGLRLAMLLLRVTSPDEVIGTTSDDGFVIGQTTLSGTYGLVSAGAFTGCVGVLAYAAVATWLVGPRWLRLATVGITSGALFGGLVINPDGVDFGTLRPTWLAVALMVGVAAISGIAIAWAVDRAAAPNAWAARGRRRWLVPLLLLAAFPFVVPFVIALAVVAALMVGVRRGLVGISGSTKEGPNFVRGLFAVVPIIGIVLLTYDLAALY